MKFCLTLISMVVVSGSLIGQEVNIIPKPASVELKQGTFTITPGTVILVQGSGMANAIAFFNDYLKSYYGFDLKKETKGKLSNVIALNFERMDNKLPGAYRLDVNKDYIDIAGDNETGVFYAVQSLLQLLPIEKSTSLKIPQLSIVDSPRFGYRGMHLDVGRHFFPVSFVKKYIDFLALHKFNVFHWHLTEDQGWRIEIKKYPALTQKGAWRNGTIIGRYPGTGNDNKRYGGFYTQEEIREVVKYAAERYIEVIPEIEMPGHSSAAIAAYPWLSCFPNESTKHPRQCAWSGDTTGKQVQQTWGVFNDVFCAGRDSTFTFLQNVIDEVVALFPSKYIHVGGDECPKENWKRCPYCQQRIKDNGLKSEHELQSYFIQRMEKYINSKGKTLIGWDEILEGGLAPKAMVMSWRGEAGGIAAAKEQHNVIMTPGDWVYLNYSQSRHDDSVTIGGYLPLEKVYRYEPVPKDLSSSEANYVLGAQGNLWTEYIGNEGIAEYMLFPRMSALSEVLWTTPAKKDYKDFERRLQVQFKRYDLWKVHYSRAYFDLSALVRPSSNNSGVLWELQSPLAGGKINYVLSPRSSALMDYTGPIDVHESREIVAWLVKDGMEVGNKLWQKFFMSKSTGKLITLSVAPSSKYPGDGAFTLVNGVQNEKGLERSMECVGFEAGTDCEAVIDLGSTQTVSNTVVHSLSSGGSWVYPPKYAEVSLSSNGTDFVSAGKTDTFESTGGTNGVVRVSFAPSTARYVKVFVKNFGTIPIGSPGAGNGAWLFLDEIEVN